MESRKVVKQQRKIVKGRISNWRKVSFIVEFLGLLEILPEMHHVKKLIEASLLLFEVRDPKSVSHLEIAEVSIKFLHC